MPDCGEGRLRVQDPGMDRDLAGGERDAERVLD
jgi:hypothetical protein